MTFLARIANAQRAIAFPKTECVLSWDARCWENCCAIISGYPAQAIELSLTAQGRPILRVIRAVQFSITHSRDLVAVVLSVETLVGIDVQYVSPGIKLQALAERDFFRR